MLFFEIAALVCILFIWLFVPSFIAHSKGRRWRVWLALSIFLPGFTLSLAIFMHGFDKDGHYVMS